MLNHELGLSLKAAAQVTDLVIGSPTAPHRVRLPVTADGAIALRIDLERFHSTANAAVASAFAFGRPRGRGRPPKPRPRRPLIDVFPSVWEIKVEHDAAKLDRLARQLRDWNAYPRGIEPGLPFIMDAATLRAVPRLALSTTKGDIDVVVTVLPDANGERGK